MTVLDIGNNISVVQSLPPLTRTGSAAAFDGAAVDTKGATWAVAIFLNGNMDGSATLTYQVEESDASGGTYTVCDKVGSDAGAADAIVAATTYADDTHVVIAVNCNNNKQFLRLVSTNSNTSAQDNAGVVILMPNYTGDADAPSFDV